LFMNVKTADLCRATNLLYTKLHQNAPNRVLNFKKFPGVTSPGPPYTGGSGEGKGGKGEGEKGRTEEEGRTEGEGRREREEGREREKERGRREGKEEKG